MILEPFVEELILAGPTPPAAVAQFKLAIRKIARTHDFYCPLCEQPLVLGAIRVAPPLKVPERFKALVNWWPVDERTE